MTELEELTFGKTFYELVQLYNFQVEEQGEDPGGGIAGHIHHQITLKLQEMFISPQGIHYDLVGGRSGDVYYELYVADTTTCDTDIEATRAYILSRHTNFCIKIVILSKLLAK